MGVERVDSGGSFPHPPRGLLFYISGCILQTKRERESSLRDSVSISISHRVELGTTVTGGSLSLLLFGATPINYNVSMLP